MRHELLGAIPVGGRLLVFRSVHQDTREGWVPSSIGKPHSCRKEAMIKIRHLFILSLSLGVLDSCQSSRLLGYEEAVIPDGR